MRIFNKNSETTQAANLAIKKLKKFFDMTKSTTNNPVLKRNGAKNSCAYSYSETYKIRLTAMGVGGEVSKLSIRERIIKETEETIK